MIVVPRYTGGRQYVEFSLKSMMWYVSFIALGIAVLRNANDVWVGVMLLITLGTLDDVCNLPIEPTLLTKRSNQNLIL